MDRFFPGADPWLMGALILAFVSLAGIWATALFINRARRDEGATIMHNPTIHNYYAPIEELARTKEVLEPPKHALVQPNSASHAHTASEAGDTLTATGVLFPLGLYTGLIIVSASRMTE